MKTATSLLLFALLVPACVAEPLTFTSTGGNDCDAAECEPDEEALFDGTEELEEDEDHVVLTLAR